MLDKVFWVLSMHLWWWIANWLWHSWSFWLSAKRGPLFLPRRCCQSAALNIVRFRHLTQFQPCLTYYHALGGTQIQIDPKGLWLFPAEMFHTGRWSHGYSGCPFLYSWAIVSRKPLEVLLNECVVKLDYGIVGDESEWLLIVTLTIVFAFGNGTFYFFRIICQSNSILLLISHFRRLSVLHPYISVFEYLKNENLYQSITSIKRTRQSLGSWFK